MSEKNILFARLICIAWAILDLAITCVWFASGSAKDLKFLTTQVWMFGMFAKLAAYLGASIGPWVWICFLVYGVLQSAILFTFFALLTMDSSILTDAMRTHDISVIITWNHLRHVTPVIFFAMLLGFIAPLLRRQIQFSNFRTAGIVIFCACVFGAVHHIFTNDGEVYMYANGHEHVGRNCGIVFANSVILSTIYYVYGLL
jgi:hypothetical protein